MTFVYTVYTFTSQSNTITVMKIQITLTEAEKAGIINYLKEVDEITEKSTQQGIDFAIEMEVRTRIYHALRDSREAIADHITDAEKKVLQNG